MRRIRGDWHHNARCSASHNGRTVNGNTMHGIKGFSERSLEAVFASLAPLRPYLNDPDVNEIQINGPGDVFIRRGAVDTRIETDLSANQISSAITVVASMNAKETGDNKRVFVLSARLPNMRIEALLPPVAIKGPSMCIRRHATRIMELDEYVQSQTMTAAQANLIRRIIASNQNLLISGGTYSGKTTLVNCLIGLIAPTQRLFCIEQVHELRVESPNCVMLECDPEQGVTPQRAVNAGMRYSPHRIIVGELRGGEALDFLNACNTGHPGSMSTIHADNAVDALSRLEDLVLQAQKLPYEAIPARIGMSLQWVLQIAMGHTGQRSITQIARIRGYDRLTKSYEIEDFTQGELT